MIYLDFTTKKLQIVLAGAITTNQLEVSSFYYDMIPQATTTLRRGGVKVASTNNTTDVDIVDAPGAHGTIRNVHTIFIHNKDTVSSTVTVKLDDSGTETILIKQLLKTGETLAYEDQSAWQVLDPSAVIVALDDEFTLQDDADTTKQGRFELSGITSGNLRTLTWPDFNGTIATLAGVETPTNKTIDLTNNTLVGSVTEFNTALESADFYTTGGTDVAVADGGTGRSTAVAYSVLCGGTTSTGVHQSVANVGTSAQVLTSNGASNLPTWQTGLPIATIIDYAGDTAPTGFLNCDGTAVSRATYSALHAILKDVGGADTYAWGNGDGSTTFNLPNLNRRVTVGSGGTGTVTLDDLVGSTGGEETHTLTTAELAAHTHGTGTLATASDGAHTHDLTADGGAGGGAGSEMTVRTDSSNTQTLSAKAQSAGNHTHTISGSTGSSGSDTAHNIIQPSAVVMKVIKY